MGQRVLRRSFSFCVAGGKRGVPDFADLASACENLVRLAKHR